MTHPNHDAFLTELSDHGLSRQVVGTLNANGLATMRELALATECGLMRTILDDDERIDVIFAVWSWMGPGLEVDRPLRGVTVG